MDSFRSPLKIFPETQSATPTRSWPSPTVFLAPLPVGSAPRQLASSGHSRDGMGVRDAHNLRPIDVDRAAFLEALTASAWAACTSFLALLTWAKAVFAVCKLVLATETAMSLPRAVASSLAQAMAFQEASAVVSLAPRPVLVAALALSRKAFFLCQADWWR